MQEFIYSLFEDYSSLAVLISFVLGLIIAILGLVPSFFLTAANIIFFGFWYGTLLSFASEFIGNLLAFYLYRKGFKRILARQFDKHPSLNKLLISEPRDAFMLIISLRIFPFIPSGLVTLSAALGKVSPMLFFAASTIGKIPALLIEASAVYGFMAAGWQLKISIAILSLILILFILIKRNKRKKN